MITAPEPGYYTSVPMDIYAAWPYVSRSGLLLMRRSAAHYKAKRDRKPTNAMKLGSAAHMAILEPELFSERYAAKGTCEEFTGKGDDRCKNSAAVMLESGQGVCRTHLKKDAPVNERVELLDASDFEACTAMRRVVAGKLRANGLISGEGEFELSIVWDEQVEVVAAGARVTVTVRCKARLDRFSALGGGTLLDIKTTQDASRHSFTKAIFDYDYHVQGGFYMRAARQVGLPAQHYALLPIEKEPPYEACVYRLTEGALDAGEEIAMALLGKLALCQHTGTWPGYEDRVEDIALPDWAWRKMDDELQELKP